MHRLPPAKHLSNLQAIELADDSRWLAVSSDRLVPLLPSERADRLSLVGMPYWVHRVACPVNRFVWHTFGYVLCETDIRQILAKFWAAKLVLGLQLDRIKVDTVLVLRG